MQITEKIHSPEAYLQFERASHDRHEYLYETIIPMAGASKEHNMIAGNLFAMLWFFLRKTENVVFQNDMRVFNPQNNSYMYPDVVISDGKPVISDEYKDNLMNPLVIFEVLSPTTAVHDKTDKFIACRSIPTLKEYILIWSDTHQIEQYKKEADGNWTVQISNQTNASLSVPSINFSCLLEELYEKI